LASGSYNVLVFVRDEFGVHDEKTVSFTVVNPFSATCSASPAGPEVGDVVTWTANPTGGTGSYTYKWSGTSPMQANTTGKSVNVTYLSAGKKNASVTVTSGGNNTTANCSVDVDAPPPTIGLKANGSGNSITIPSGTAANLTWWTADATSCSAGWANNASRPIQKGQPGESTGNLTSDKTFVLTCSGPGGTSQDSVKVKVGAQAGGTINVTSNISTTWTITGNGSFLKSPGYPAPVTSGQYTNQPSGIYNIFPAEIDGYYYRVNVADTQNLGVGGSLIFTIIYADLQEPSPTLRTNPTSNPKPTSPLPPAGASPPPPSPASPALPGTRAM
jgi:hypothetical protein